MEKSAALIVAAGRGKRMENPVPKQFLSLAGAPVLRHTLARFLSLPEIDEIIVVCRSEDQEHIAALDLSDRIKLSEGGTTRSASVRAGLEQVTRARVLIHDGVRPFADPALIRRVLSALDTYDGAAPALPVIDALWRKERDIVQSVQDRSDLFYAQTPQGFHTQAIRRAYQTGIEGDDDVAVALQSKLDVKIVEGMLDNFKLTYPDDFLRAEKLIKEGWNLE